MATNREKTTIRRIMGPIASPCVMELGARTAEDEPWIREACVSYKPEQVHYIMVEPDQRNCQVILDVPTGTYKDRCLIMAAVAAYDGLVTFYGGEDPDGARTSGSIRRPTGHYESYPHHTFPDELRTVVPCFTLDSLYKRCWIGKIDLLWVDIQGAERDMIEGGQKALEHTRYLFMETYDRELYEGMATRDELLAMLPGWHVVEDFGDNVLLWNPLFCEGKIE